MLFTNADVTAIIGTYLWPFFRIAALVGAAPVFGNRLVPMRLKMVVAIALTVVIAPSVPPVPAVDGLSLAGLWLVMEQVLIGVAMGFILHLVFSVFVLGGQVIAMTMGLGFASLNDPITGVVVPTVAQFYTIMVTLVFLVLDGHLLLVRVLAESFTTLPIGAGGISADGMWQVLVWAGEMFAGATLVALPAVGAMLIVNLGFGIMTRAAPQLNLFAIGFPVIMTMGMVIILFSLPSVVPIFSALLDGAFAAMRALVTPGA